ncbi:MAG: hypothetical protein Q9162_002275 [Coniocarpon cinnabarinum]
MSSSLLPSFTGAANTSVIVADSAPAPSHSLVPVAAETSGFLWRTMKALPATLLWLVTFITVTLPTWLFTFFSTGLTITMNATTLVLVVLAIVSTISWFVRYRFLNIYSRLPPEPARKEPHVDLFPEVPEHDSKRGLSNYLDEFLSAIKVFGYLERPVFHELTRTMQTRKLIAGETILLEEEQGFCLVVDGLVQIFVKSRRDEKTSPSDEEEEEEHLGRGRQGYQLLTEVKNGAPLSSLFSILSLFTEDVKLRYDDDDTHESRPSSAPYRHHSRQTSSLTPLDTGNATPASELVHSAEPAIPARTRKYSQRGQIPPLSLDDEDDRDVDGKHSEYARSAKRRRLESAHPDIVARATVDTTIAIIPATAFKRLTRTYPKASSHIVQVILTRLQRVTLTTGHAYLGLTGEVLSTEKLMNQYTTYDLPAYLHGLPLERLKEKFAREQHGHTTEQRSKGVALHNPKIRQARKSSATLHRDTAAEARLAARRSGAASPQVDGSSARFFSSVGDSSRVNAGDLLGGSPASSDRGRTSRLSMTTPIQTMNSGEEFTPNKSPTVFKMSGKHPFPMQRQDSHDEDSVFRDSIVDCMLKAIGLTSVRGPALQRTESVPQSPHLVSYDSKRQKAFFSNAFGFMDALDVDGESESMISMPASATSATNSPINIQDELSNDVEIVFFPKNSVLVEQGERNPGLYYVIDGFLDVSVPEEVIQASNGVGSLSPLGEAFPNSSSKVYGHARQGSDKATKKNTTRRSLYLTKPGGLAGYLGTISSRRSFVDITAKTDVYVGFLPRASIERIVEKYPIVLLTMAKRLTSLLPRLILHIDFALEWVQVDAGQAIFREGDDSDAIYIVLNGRLRMLRMVNGKPQVMGEYGQGDSVGELEVLTESRRPGTLHAIRDTELAKLPKTLFNSLALENPEITIKISKLIATRMRDLTEDAMHDVGQTRASGSVGGLAASTINLRTVSILPVTSGVPVVEFGSRLLSALSQIGTASGVTSLNQAAILNHLGRHAFNRMGKLKLSQHLADLEEKYGLVLYVADTNVNSPWTQTCISQADCILLVGLAEGSPEIGEYERFLMTSKTTARKELVLLHAERYCQPGLTRKWLRNRLWINGSHHHVHMSFRTTAEPVHPQARRFGFALKQRVQTLQQEIQKYTSRRLRQTPLYSSEQTPFKGDFHRLARRLTGKSVGLVLGGGGSRGLSQIGIIRAMEEAGVPIDIVGGTSIGAFVGGLYAWDADMVPLYGRAKKFAGRMGSIWRFALDLTYPSASYTTGHEFNRGIFKTFGTAQIEDFWLEFYCNTTNISKSRQEFHTSGYVWRYVRASMSLAGLVPPLCDEGSLLVDGGYLDNLTVNHMKSLGASLVFAVDVGSLDDQTLHSYGDSLSGFWAAFNRWNPFSSFANPPTLSEIQGKLAYVSSIDALERAKNTPGVRYMRPPVVEYATLDFGKFEEIVKVGFEYGTEFLRGLRKEVGEGREGVLAFGPGETGEERKLRRTMAPRRASV